MGSISSGLRINSNTVFTKAGKATKINIVPNQKKWMGNIVKLNPNKANNAIGVTLRRKLSNILNFDKSDKGLTTRLPAAFNTRGNNQLISCQSPRIQRMKRLVSAK